MGKIGVGEAESLIVAEYFIGGAEAFGPQHRSLKTLTICVLVLRNGFTVVGESNCVDPADFDEGLGRQVARGKAVAQIWPLHGYLLKQVDYLRLQDLKGMEAIQG